jgi:hypothetical protein
VSALPEVRFNSEYHAAGTRVTRGLPADTSNSAERFDMDIDRRSLLAAAAIVATGAPARAQAAPDAVPLWPAGEDSTMTPIRSINPAA